MLKCICYIVSDSVKIFLINRTILKDNLCFYNNYSDCNSNNIKLDLNIANNMTLASPDTIQITCDPKFIGSIYLKNSYRGKPNNEYIIHF